MSNVDKAIAEKAKNYSAVQVAAIIAASPLDLDSAKIVAEQIGKTSRSVIAKALSLSAAGEDVVYTSKPAPVKREAVETKAEIVAEIAAALDVSLSGLDKATVSALCALRSAVNSLTDDDFVPAD
jgi:hypothetical protein